MNFHLEHYEGPLDLLLDLIRKQQINIYDIPIASVTTQYLEYIARATELDIELSAEFVYMAATLIYIKSRMLLPHPPGAETEDPRLDLARRLQEYERFKKAAEDLHEIDTLRAGLWPRAEVEVPRSADGEVLEVSLFDLIDVFRKVTERYRFAHPPALEIRHLRFSVADKMRDLVGRLEAAASLPLLEFFGEMHYRAEAVTAFLATLELVRLGVVTVFQHAPFGEIHVSRTGVPFSLEQIKDTYR